MATGRLIAIELSRFPDLEKLLQRTPVNPDMYSGPYSRHQDIRPDRFGYPLEDAEVVVSLEGETKQELDGLEDAVISPNSALGQRFPLKRGWIITNLFYLKKREEAPNLIARIANTRPVLGILRWAQPEYIWASTPKSMFRR